MRTRGAWSRPLLSLAALALLGAPASAVEIEWVFVGDPGNPPDAAENCYAVNCGSVPYAYSIAKSPVTNAQYAEFLNTKAAADPLELYSPSMGSSLQGGITRSGTIGSFQYTVKPGFENKPVNFVTFYDALRFINWLGNGQGGGDTEDGAYTLLGGTPEPSNGVSVVFNRGTIFLPSENEWYKAAYWDPGPQSFLDFPAGSNDLPVCAAPGPTPNTANCGSVIGNVTDVGAYTGSASPNGTFDQGGNVFEWNEQIVGGSFRGVRGGFWGGSASELAASFRVIGDPSAEDLSSIGFRVASLVPVPEPDASPLALIVLAGLAARQERRKRSRALGVVALGGVLPRRRHQSERGRRHDHRRRPAVADRDGARARVPRRGLAASRARRDRAARAGSRLDARRDDQPRREPRSLRSSTTS